MAIKVGEWATRNQSALTWALLAVLFLGFAPVVPVNHDESQYLGAAALTYPGLPYIDYPYMQTPLQPLLTAPIAKLAGIYSFIALRLITALMALATLWLIFRSQRLLGVGQATAVAMAVLVAATYSFQFSATLVRNDILPVMLEALGLFLALAALTGIGRPRNWLLSGLAFGAAAGAKISFALPAFAVGIYHLVTVARRRDKGALTDAVACAAGAFISFLPVALLYWQAPAAFRYGVLEFGATAPHYWYELNGIGYRLGLDWKAIDTATVLWRGPAWVALVVVAIVIVRRSERESRHLLLDLLVVGGLVAALLPTPTWRQYLLPLLPPLFVRFGLIWEEGSIAARWRRIVAVLCALASIHGVLQPATWGKRIAKGKPTPVSMTREAHWIGQRLRESGSQGEIATLSPQVVVDSGFPLDPRFAPGPFAYRSGNLLTEARQREFGIVAPATLDRFLTERPPAAIVTGYESRAQFDKIDLDEGLRQFALRNGYRMHQSPFGAAQLFVRPNR